MARIKGGLGAKKKHNRVLKLAKGYRGARSKQLSLIHILCGNFHPYDFKPSALGEFRSLGSL